MLLPNEVRKCVAFVGFKSNDDRYHLAGTVFFVGLKIEGKESYHAYAITAKHVINGIKNMGYDKIYLRLNFFDGEARWIESNIAVWSFHPKEPEVDVAIAKISFGNEGDHIIWELSTSDTNVALSGNIGIGDEVYIAGLFAHHHGKRRNIPIIRAGNIAAMPEEPVQTRLGLIDAYLIEARSIGGISGSPVFIFKLNTRNPIYCLLGMVHGHWDSRLSEFDAMSEDTLDKERVNTGIAIVVPTSKIIETLNQPLLRKVREEQEELWRQRQL